MFNREEFDSQFGEGAYDKVYSPNPVKVKVVLDQDDVTISCGQDSIKGSLGNELLMNILSMLTYHASDRLSSFLSEDLTYAVEMLTIDFNSVARESDEKWVDDDEMSLD